MSHIRPQRRQEIVLSNGCDVQLFGGSSGGGKTFTILMSPLRWLLTIPEFYGVIFRRTTPQITAPGGLWDAAIKLYGNFPQLRIISSRREIVNDRLNSRLSFRHLEREVDVLSWQGTELSFIGMDEATHFTEYQVNYLMSRLRTMSGINPYMLMTCNPDSDSWLMKYVEWYLTEEGTPDPDKSDTVRYYTRDSHGEMVWSAEPSDDSTSFVFCPASVHDNQELLKRDKDYIKRLESLPLVERQRLLDQNWYARPEAGKYLNRSWWQYIAKEPQYCRRVRYWDRAATLQTKRNNDPDYTAGVLVAESMGNYYVLDVCRFRGTPAMVQSEIERVSKADGYTVQQVLEVDPGQAGKFELSIYQSSMEQPVEGNRVRTSKTERVWSASRLCESGKLFIVGDGAWIKPFIDECHNFGSGNGHDDQVDGLSGAVNSLNSGKPFMVETGRAGLGGHDRVIQGR